VYAFSDQWIIMLLVLSQVWHQFITNGDEFSHCRSGSMGIFIIEEIK
jgi:hypothetical protein